MSKYKYVGKLGEIRVAMEEQLDIELKEATERFQEGLLSRNEFIHKVIYLEMMCNITRR